ncbi:unnamed protein product [Danaus chrysippus]|uniref:(African queen) hypothetical protein n=1 Tax=Danaus chrysippus TaxID=151541 RepID=A0A8J2VPI8_9NEOP|nr:unnamed protein product [Danaus chrysippus]
MLINTFLDTEDFVHLYYPEDEAPAAQGCGAGARLASKYPRPPSPDYKQVNTGATTYYDRHLLLMMKRSQQVTIHGSHHKKV